MPVWGWVCIGLTVAAVIVIVIANMSEKKARDYTMRHGDPTIGWIVQANNALFEEGVLDYPALVLISKDEDTANDEAFMTELAEDIMDLKGVDCDDDDEEFVSGLVTDETYVAGKRDKVPKAFCGRPNVYLAHIYIYREHLPKKRLTQKYVCCQVVWDEPGTLICTRPWKGRKKRDRRDEDED
jgi:hypothetical protein